MQGMGARHIPGQHDLCAPGHANPGDGTAGCHKILLEHGPGREGHDEAMTVMVSALSPPDHDIPAEEDRQPKPPMGDREILKHQILTACGYHHTVTKLRIQHCGGAVFSPQGEV